LRASLSPTKLRTMLACASRFAIMAAAMIIGISLEVPAAA
jgi:hypothetical protein